MLTCAVQSPSSDDASVIRISIGRRNGTVPMLVIPPAIGVILILFGIVLFIIDLSVTNHGLPTAGGIVALLAGGLALLGAGIPYSGVLLGACSSRELMWVLLFRVLGTCAPQREPPSAGRYYRRLAPSELVVVNSEGGCSCTASCGGPC